jgi:hypothetical protein
MEKKKSQTLEIFFKIINSIANFAVIIGLIIAYYEYKSTDEREREMEQRRYAVEAMSDFSSFQFLKSLSILSIEDTITIPITTDFIDAANYVFNSYYHLSVIYNNNLADNSIIAESMKIKLQAFVDSDLFKNGFPKYDWDSISTESIKKMVDNINKKK